LSTTASESGGRDQFGQVVSVVSRPRYECSIGNCERCGGQGDVYHDPRRIMDVLCGDCLDESREGPIPSTHLYNNAFVGKAEVKRVKAHSRGETYSTRNRMKF